MSDTSELLQVEYDRKAWAADALIGARLIDARAQAELGDLPTAKARLDELATSLVAKHKDARAEFYERSFAHYRREGLDPTVHQVELQPTPKGEKAAREATIWGDVLEFDVRDLVKDAAASLTSVALAAGRSRTPPAARTALWTNWQADQHRKIDGYSRRALSDAQMSIHNAVGTILERTQNNG